MKATENETCDQIKSDGSGHDRCHSADRSAVLEKGANEDSLIPADGFLYTDTALSDHFPRERLDSSGSLDQNRTAAHCLSAQFTSHTFTTATARQFESSGGVSQLYVGRSIDLQLQNICQTKHVTSGEAKPKYSQSHVPPAKL